MGRTGCISAAITIHCPVVPIPDNPVTTG